MRARGIELAIFVGDEDDDEYGLVLLMRRGI